MKAVALPYGFSCWHRGWLSMQAGAGRQAVVITAVAAKSPSHGQYRRWWGWCAAAEQFKKTRESYGV